MHSAHHLEPPPVHLATDEVLLGVEYSTPSTVEPRQRQCMLLNVMHKWEEDTLSTFNSFFKTE